MPESMSLDAQHFSIRRQVSDKAELQELKTRQPKYNRRNHQTYVQFTLNQFENDAQKDDGGKKDKGITQNFERFYLKRRVIQYKPAIFPVVSVQNSYPLKTSVDC